MHVVYKIDDFPVRLDKKCGIGDSMENSLKTSVHLYYTNAVICK